MQVTQDFREIELLGRDGATETMELELLGSGSSFREYKDRWFEVSIYRERDGRFVLHTVGRSTREGDRDLGRIAKTSSAFELVELLTVTHKGETYVPQDSTRALAQAADRDPKIREAYLRMVA